MRRKVYSNIWDLFCLHHKPLAPIGFMEAKMDCLLPVIWRRFFNFIIVTP